jgi:hypothetical protein
MHGYAAGMDFEVPLFWTQAQNLANCKRISTGVARWFVFKPKIPIWVNFGGP